MSDIFTKVIAYDPDKEIQLRLTINEFRGIQYLHLRKYFLDFEGEWVPTKDGVSMPLTILTTLKLFLALSEIMSSVEKDLLDDTLSDIIKSYSESLPNDEIPH